MKHPRIPWPALAVVVLVPLIYVVVLGSNGEPTRRAVELLRAVADVVHSAPSRLDTGAGTMTVTAVKQLGGNSMVTSSTEIIDAAGLHVVTAVSSLVVRGPEEGEPA